MKLWKIGANPEELVLTFPAPTEPLSINKAHTLHWAPRRELTNPWREMGQMAAMAARRKGRDHVAGWWCQGETPVTISVALPFRTAVRRDPPPAGRLRCSRRCGTGCG